MNATEVQDTVIPLITEYMSVMVIEADQPGEYPDAPHVVFKITVPYTKSIGRPAVTGEERPEGYSEVLTEDYNLTISFTSVSEAVEEARANAQRIRDWFEFFGYEELSLLNVAISGLGDVQNRNSVIDDESREGFDVVLRVHRELTRIIPWIENVEVTKL